MFCAKTIFILLEITDLSIFFLRILLESDPTAIAQRVGKREEDVPLGEQTVAQVSRYLSLLVNFLRNVDTTTDIFFVILTNCLLC